jgi:spore germination cell wall hydrolase CwlJ-like protein
MPVVPRSRRHKFVPDRLLQVRPAAAKPTRSKTAWIGFGALVLALLPTSIGYQDLGALLARRPAVTERARAHLIESPFGTIHAATFSLPRPVGTLIPHPPVYALANFDPSDITASIGSQWLGDNSAPIQFPTVNRKSKRDSLKKRARAPMPPLPPLLAIKPVPTSVIDKTLDKLAGAPPRLDNKPKNTERVFFETDAMAAGREAIAPWAPGEAPVVLAMVDPDIKPSALESLKPAGKGDKADDKNGGVSVANKGEVTGIDKRPRSPAERMALAGAPRAKAEKCLANAVYFEARDEPVRAQIAVAQVVLNRVFSPFYPNDVCGVVYQNAHRHLACQFTFACDGKSKAIVEPEAWARAMRIAKDTLDGKLWMPDVAKSTHYHDDWAHPNWVREMRKLDKLGGLIFYRPRNWGDGADEPRWGDAATTAREVKKL